MLPLQVTAYIRAVGPANAPGIGGNDVTIIGGPFGTGSSEMKVRVGGTAAIKTRWVSDSSCVATVAAGIFVLHGFLFSERFLARY